MLWYRTRWLLLDVKESRPRTNYGGDNSDASIGCFHRRLVACQEFTDRHLAARAASSLAIQLPHGPSAARPFHRFLTRPSRTCPLPRARYARMTALIGLLFVRPEWLVDLNDYETMAPWLAARIDCGNDWRSPSQLAGYKLGRSELLGRGVGG